MAAGDLTTLVSLKAFLALSGSGSDAMLGELITQTSAAIRNYCGRDLTSTDYTKTFDGNGKQVSFFSQFPITAVASLTINGLAVPAITKYGQQGYVFSNNTVKLVGYWFETGVANCAITFTAGYTTIPPDLSKACNEWCAQIYKQRETIGLTSKSIGQESVSFDTTGIPDKITATIGNYRVVTGYV